MDMYVTYSDFFFYLFKLIWNHNVTDKNINNTKKVHNKIESYNGKFRKKFY